MFRILGILNLGGHYSHCRKSWICKVESELSCAYVKFEISCNIQVETSSQQLDKWVWSSEERSQLKYEFGSFHNIFKATWPKISLRDWMQKEERRSPRTESWNIFHWLGIDLHINSLEGYSRAHSGASSHSVHGFKSCSCAKDSQIYIPTQNSPLRSDIWVPT